ncbi:hypothetical protein O6H91_01G156900 [Diphasiastrum complanatum]|uniref:Uncharacterized protein n=1 Tax=Diphasiastrum complanatum TaxID=34168 RepID=A0ACC2EXN6_DIPCM|nr:hypothetical protein O6H91_01G156900 [Diphasiastrum complanatum]
MGTSTSWPFWMEQEGLSLKAAEVRPLVESIQEKRLHVDYFNIGSNRYVVTSIHEHIYCGRCLNSVNPAGSGAIIACTPFNAIVATYDGSIGAASKAMATVETFFDHLTQSFA